MAQEQRMELLRKHDLDPNERDAIWLLCFIARLESERGNIKKFEIQRSLASANAVDRGWYFNRHLWSQKHRPILDDWDLKINDIAKRIFPEQAEEWVHQLSKRAKALMGHHPMFLILDPEIWSSILCPMQTLSILWHHQQWRAITVEFLKVVSSIKTLACLEINAAVLHQDSADLVLEMYDLLGKALGQSQAIDSILVTQHRTTSTVLAIANIMRHLRYMKKLEWRLKRSPSTINENYEALQVALAQNTTTEKLICELTMGRYREAPTEMDSVAITGLFQAFCGLSAVQLLSITGGVFDRSAMSLADLIHQNQQTVRELYLMKSTFLGFEGALAVSRVIAESNLVNLRLDKTNGFFLDQPTELTGPASGVPVTPVSVLLQSQYLQKLELESLNIPSLESGSAFATALSLSRIEDLSLNRVSWPLHATVTIAGGVCSPLRRSLVFTFVQDTAQLLAPFVEGLGLWVGPRLTLKQLCIRQSEDEVNSVDDFFQVCSRCPFITHLETKSDTWTSNSDRLAAECVDILENLRGLRLHVSSPSQSRELYTGLRLLQALHRHINLESVTLSGHWSNAFKDAVGHAMVGVRYRRYQQRFFALTADVIGNTRNPGFLAKALFKVFSEPELQHGGIAMLLPVVLDRY